MQSEFTLQRSITDTLRKKLVRSNPDSLVGTPDGASAKHSLSDLVAGLARLCYRYPLFIIGALWPLVLLAPHFPGIPRPSIGGLPWRQELGLSLLLTVALGLLIKVGQNEKITRIDRGTLPVLFTFGVFVCWTLSSAVWATNTYAAIHLGMQWSIYLVFFFLMNSILRNPKLMRASFVALAAVIWVLAIACAIESWFGAPLTDGNLRNDLKPILRGSGGFGEIMAMAAILFAALSLQANRRGRALVFGASAMMAWLATLQSLERAPLVGATAGFCLLIAGSVITKPTGRRPWGRLGLMVGALGLILFFQSLPLSNAEPNAATPSTVGRFTLDLNDDASARARFLFWGVGLEMARAHPLLGVGGNNYEAAYATARTQFSARYPNSSLVALNEHLLTVYAHNEYLQLMTELGFIGLLLFVLFSLSLVAALWRALNQRSQILPALGAGGAMLAFAVSSGASGSSFRYFGGGLVFFFGAAILTRIAAGAQTSSPNKSKAPVHPGGALRQVMTLGLCALMLLTTSVLSTQGAGTVLHGLAQVSPEPAKAEAYYQSSLRVYPASPATHFGYGIWLYNNRRGAEAVPHLRHAVENGFNSSICYAYLAGAADSAGDLTLAERTLATAVRVYPASVFLLVRHAAALARNGRGTESKEVFSRAFLLDPRGARGWQQLIDNDIDAAYIAAKQDVNIALPGELYPEAAVFEVLQENEQRFPAAVHTGWRARMRAQQSN
ncbi:MAG: O-antigen ligase family protein [Pyrinomonadaceae bacterium]|nr:O-antigen ligase family protein [Pyrinomonadaceae bacterium]